MQYTLLVNQNAKIIPCNNKVKNESAWCDMFAKNSLLTPYDI